MSDMIFLGDLGAIVFDHDPWTDKIKWQPLLRLTGSTFNEWLKQFDLFPEQKQVVSPNGKWTFKRLKVRAGFPLKTFNDSECRKHGGWDMVDSMFAAMRQRIRCEGHIIFDSEIQVPALFERKQLTPWMSLTPNEVFTLRGGLRAAKGHVALAGLGMGYQAICVANKPAVTHLTIVEQDQDLFDWLFPIIQQKFPKELPVDWQIGDANVLVPKMQADVALIDIFPKYGNNNFAQCPDIGKVWVWGQGKSKLY